MEKRPGRGYLEPASHIAVPDRPFWVCERPLAEATDGDRLDLFGQVVDEILNAILFVLIGLEVLVMSFRNEYVNAVLVLIPGVLFARTVSTGVPWLRRRPCRFDRGALPVLVWGGLRGGLWVLFHVAQGAMPTPAIGVWR